MRKMYPLEIEIFLLLLIDMILLRNIIFFLYMYYQDLLKLWHMFAGNRTYFFGES